MHIGTNRISGFSSRAEAFEYLSDAVPVDDDSLGVKRVLELHMDRIAGLGADGGAGELAVDPYQNFLVAVRRCVDIPHLPFEMSGLGSRSSLQQDRDDAGGDEQERERARCHIWRSR